MHSSVEQAEPAEGMSSREAEFIDELRRHRHARPQRPLPPPITDPDTIAHLNLRRRDHLGGLLHEHELAA